jgi:hypothetical protein
MGSLVAGVGACVIAGGVLAIMAGSPALGAPVILAGAVLVIFGLRS